ncbi:MAG: dethiobiotin synthase [Ruminococcus sp.]|nr:dethiobiotin synthase [Ruminococcus sp.]
MSKALFITATGTDVGKTYVTALIVKKLRESGINAGYYKAALSGAESIADSDAGYVNKTAGINQPENTLLSYMYKTAVSPHLAAKIEGNPVTLEKIKADFSKVAKSYDFVTVEGAGGIVCPIRYDETAHIFLEDIIRTLDLGTVIIADAGLGTINAVVTTAEYIKSRNIDIKGVILNNWAGGIMQEDNAKMITDITGLEVLAKVKKGDTSLDIDPEKLAGLYN